MAKPRLAIPNEVATTILESLSYSKKQFREYRGYPSEEYRRERVQDVSDAEAWVRRALGR